MGGVILLTDLRRAILAQGRGSGGPHRFQRPLQLSLRARHISPGPPERGGGSGAASVPPAMAWRSQSSGCNSGRSPGLGLLEPSTYSLIPATEDHVVCESNALGSDEPVPLMRKSPSKVGQPQSHPHLPVAARLSMCSCFVCHVWFASKQSEIGVVLEGGGGIGGRDAGPGGPPTDPDPHEKRDAWSTRRHMCGLVSVAGGSWPRSSVVQVNMVCLGSVVLPHPGSFQSGFLLGGG